MYHLQVYLFFLTSLCCSARQNFTVTTNFITDGADAKINDFPFVCALYYKDIMHCGSSIISEEWILTAGHCLYDTNPDYHMVLCGMLKRSVRDDSNQIRSVDKIFVHPEFGPKYSFEKDMHRTSYTHDIGLVRFFFCLFM